MKHPKVDWDLVAILVFLTVLALAALGTITARNYMQYSIVTENCTPGKTEKN